MAPEATSNGPAHAGTQSDELERVMVEHGDVVGTTAVISHHRIRPTLGRRPTQYRLFLDFLTYYREVPAASETDQILMDAGSSTALLITEFESPRAKFLKTFQGTAFFISRDRLLTAGHNLQYHENSIQYRLKSCRIATPGTTHVDLRKVHTIDCTLVKNFLPAHDIAILKICDGYCATFHLKLAPKESSPGSLIDVVGYPGDRAQHHLETRTELNVTDEYPFDKHVKDAQTFLPTRTLVLSRGLLYKETDGTSDQEAIGELASSITISPHSPA
jgi:hypothetical protein